MNTRKPIFWIVRDTIDNVLEARFGKSVTLRRVESLAFIGYDDNTGHFQEGYSPNLISGNPEDLDISGPEDVLKCRLGSIIWDARLEYAKSSGQAANPDFFVSPDIQEADDVEYGIKGTKWTLNHDANIWEQEESK